MRLMQYAIFAARIEDGDPGYEHDTWTVPSQSSDEPTLLELTDGTSSGVHLFNTVHMIYT